MTDADAALWGEIARKQSEHLVEFMNLPKIRGALIITDIEGEGYVTSGVGTTTTAKTPEMMKDDAICMVCQKHCCAEQPFTKNCECCPLYQFIQYQEARK